MCIGVVVSSFSEKLQIEEVLVPNLRSDMDYVLSLPHF